MAKTRLLNLFRSARLGARERAEADAAQKSIAAGPSLTSLDAPQPPTAAGSAADRSMPECLAVAVELREAGRFEEAELLLIDAMERFPEEPRPRF
jgi:hypothetical protein